MKSSPKYQAGKSLFETSSEIKVTLNEFFSEKDIESTSIGTWMQDIFLHTDAEYTRQYATKRCVCYCFCKFSIFFIQNIFAHHQQPPLLLNSLCSKKCNPYDTPKGYRWLQVCWYKKFDSIGNAAASTNTRKKPYSEFVEQKLNELKFIVFHNFNAAYFELGLL